MSGMMPKRASIEAFNTIRASTTGGAPSCHATPSP